MFNRRKPQYVPPAPQPAPAPRPAAPTVDQAVQNATMRQGHLEARMRKCEGDIESLKKELARTRPGTSQHSMYKRRILAAMRERKRIDQQIGSSFAQQSNLTAVQDAQYQLNEAAETGAMLQEQNRVMQGQMRKVNIDTIQDAQDDMREHLQDTQDIQEILGQEYGVDGIDDAELEAELEGLGEEMGFEQNVGAEATPSYLMPQQSATPSYASPAGSAAPNDREANPAYLRWVYCQL